MKIKLEKPNYQLIPRFTRSSSWAVDVGWQYLSDHVLHHVKDYGLDLEPDFQRAHVWDGTKRIAFVEYCLRGGLTGKDLYFNCVGWQHALDKIGPYVIVDGKQRLNAVMSFMSGEIPAFGYYRSEYTGHLRIFHGFKWHVNDLETREEVLQWYLDLNVGGVVHTDEEIDKVRKLLAKERRKGGKAKSRGAQGKDSDR